MECSHRMIDQEQLMNALPELLQNGAEFPLVISGSSMYPFLKHGRDTVYLSKTKRRICVGDMILYRRHGGAPVLHRVVSVCDGELTLLGDRQTALESGVALDSVLAIVTAVRRKGRMIRQGHPIWFFFARVWPKMVRIRPKLIRIYAFVNGDKEI